MTLCTFKLFNGYDAYAYVKKEYLESLINVCYQKTNVHTHHYGSFNPLLITSEYSWRYYAHLMNLDLSLGHFT